MGLGNPTERPVNLGLATHRRVLKLAEALLG